MLQDVSAPVVRDSLMDETTIFDVIQVVRFSSLDHVVEPSNVLSQAMFRAERLHAEMTLELWRRLHLTVMMNKLSVSDQHSKLTENKTMMILNIVGSAQTTRVSQIQLSVIKIKSSMVLGIRAGVITIPVGEHTLGGVEKFPTKSTVILEKGHK